MTVEFETLKITVDRLFSVYFGESNDNIFFLNAQSELCVYVCMYF